jgi:hypothetical protein
MTMRALRFLYTLIQKCLLAHPFLLVFQRQGASFLQLPWRSERLMKNSIFADASPDICGGV